MQSSQIARIGDYVIERQLGAGGMGVVYLAKQISMHRVVALKVLRDSLVADRVYIDRFLHEVRLLAKMEHPNMVQVYSGGEDRGHIYFSMEYVQGDDLKRAIDLRRKFTEQEAADIAAQVASALDYAWERERMIHRDIKPANIVLCYDRTVKLLDLGISKQVQPGTDVFVTNTGVMIGSPSYMSPEQARAERDIDFRADIYSLGISLYQLLTGKVPYEGKSAVDVVTQHLSAPVPDIHLARPDISRRMAKMIRRMMAKDKNDRYSSWHELRQDMLRIKNSTAAEKQKNPAKFRIPVYCYIFPLLLILGTAAAGILAGSRNKTSVPEPNSNRQVVSPAENSRPENRDAENTAESVYRKISRNYKEVLQEKNGAFLREAHYEQAIQYLETQPDLPAEFREDGKYRQNFLEDVPLQMWINDHLKQFRKREMQSSRILGK